MARPPFFTLITTLILAGLFIGPAFAQAYDADVVSDLSRGIAEQKTMDQSQPVQPAVQTGKAGGAAIQGVLGFDDIYQDVGTLLNKYGQGGRVELAKIPNDPAKDRLMGYLKENKIPTDNVILTENLKIYGTGHSPAQTAADFARGGQTAKDPWGKDYNVILASDKGGNRIASTLGTAGNNLGLKAYNPELSKATYITLKGDIHSQATDVFRQQSGKSVHILAREMNIMGAPGSKGAGYVDDISGALRGANCAVARVWVGEKDNIAGLPSNAQFGNVKPGDGKILTWTFGGPQARGVPKSGDAVINTGDGIIQINRLKGVGHMVYPSAKNPGDASVYANAMKNHPPSAMSQFDFKVKPQTAKTDSFGYTNKEPLAGGAAAAPAAVKATQPAVAPMAIKATQPAVTPRVTLPNLPASSPIGAYTPTYRTYTPNYNYGAVHMGKTPAITSPRTTNPPKMGIKHLSD